MRTTLAMSVLAAAAITLVVGSVDEFQCACGYNVRKHVKRLRTLLGAGVNELDVANVAAGYGVLASRMLLVAHGRPHAAPTAGWLWLLNFYADMVQQQVQEGWAGPVANGIGRVDDELRDYVRVCSGRDVARDAALWTQQKFEKYVLENMTAIVADDGRSEKDFRPRWLYLNDVAGNGTVDSTHDDDDDDLGGVLAQGVGVDWRTTASLLRHIYGLSARKWVFGTAELVLYQKKFLSAVAASMMGYVLIHVNLCRNYWAANMRGVAKDDGSVDEYSRVWMSIGNLLQSFRTYLDLGSEKYIGAMLDVAANPALDDVGFRWAMLTVETNIANLGDGLFGVKRMETSTVVVNAAGKGKVVAGDSKENTLIGLIALVDNNISCAQNYLKTVQGRLENVDFRIVRDFMKSTHIWLT